MSFADKVVLVTGAGSGIGRAAAIQFARDGGRVFGADIDVSGLSETARAISANGGKFEPHTLNVSDESGVVRLLETIDTVAGRLDVAFNNAGISGPSHRLEDYPADEFARVISINLVSVFLCMKYQMPLMRRPGGVICNTASIAALGGPSGLSAYAASKSGIHALTRVAALENASRGIRVNSLAPGLTDTPMVAAARAANAGFDEMARSGVPMKRAAEPEEIAAAALWLCSSASSYVTGQMLVVDGGMTVSGYEPDEAG